MANKLSDISGMPQVDDALSGWFSTITISIVTQTIVDGFNKDTETTKNFQGVIQPLSAEELKLKPEGLRSWQWLMIHCLAGSLNLKTNDKIIYKGTPFKVMDTWDYTLNGYIQYDVIRDYDKDNC